MQFLQASRQIGNGFLIMLAGKKKFAVARLGSEPEARGGSLRGIIIGPYFGLSILSQKLERITKRQTEANP